MYKLIIADDEALARYVFRTIISNNLPNIEIVDEVDNGIDALELAKRLKPDIVVLDIKMPGMNGIEVASQILEELPDTIIYILTAYDNFEYIQKALEIGVKAYFLKPLKKDEVVSKINKSLSKFENNRIKKTEKSFIDSFVREELTLKLIQGSLIRDKFDQYLQFLGLSMEAGYFMSFTPDENNLNDDKLEHKLGVIAEIVESVFQKRKKEYFKIKFGKNITFFNLLKKKVFINKAKEGRTGIAQEIIDICKNNGTSISCGIGNIYHDINKYKDSYKESVIALKSSKSNGNYVKYEDMNRKQKESIQRYPYNVEKNLYESIKMRDFGNAKKEFENIIQWIIEKDFSLEEGKEYFTEFLIIVKREIIENFNLNEKCFVEDSFRINEIDTFKTIEMLLAMIRNDLIIVFDKLEKNELSTEKSNLDKLQNIIIDDKLLDFNLQELADKLGISPQYLSRIFKEKYGMNFIDYITNKKLQHAKSLLINTEKSIKEISVITGYTDPNYFSRVFKKFMNVTPNKYRKKSKR